MAVTLNYLRNNTYIPLYIPIYHLIHDTSVYAIMHVCVCVCVYVCVCNTPAIDTSANYADVRAPHLMTSLSQQAVGVDDGGNVGR